MERSESIANLTKALVKAQSEMGSAKKDSKNPFFKSNYADLNALREAALPSLHANKLTISQPPTYIDGIDFINTIIYHESGEFVSSLNRVVVGKQNDPQAFMAAQTYTRRGAFQATLCMGAEDDDGNSISGRIVEEKPSGFKKTTESTTPDSETEPESKPATRSFRRK